MTRMMFTICFGNGSFTRSATAIACGVMASVSAWAQPVYQITAISLPGQSASGGQGISASGNFVTGFVDADGARWDAGTGTTALPGFSGRPFSAPQAVNDAGVVVGTGATTFFGSGALPLIWSDTGSVAQLPLPAGETVGRAFDINNAGQVVGSVNGGSVEVAVVYTTGSAEILTPTMPNGGVLRTAYGINDAGRIVGQALDPTNAAVTRGFYLDPGDATASDLGALTALGHNSAIPFAVSSNGLVAGSSSINSGADARPFIWSESTGMSAVPLLAGTTTGGARGVNIAGWVVGTMSSTTAIPYLYTGVDTYRLQDLLNGTGDDWDLVSGTSNGAFDIADNGVITGRGLLNGELTGFVMTPVPEPSMTVFGGILVATGWLRRRRMR